nr:OmpA family protein [uncultured Pseudodesulfovibrio sp.]
MQHIEKTRESARRAAVAYQETQIKLYDALMDEFRNDLSKWGASIDPKTLSVKFDEPDVLFSSGSSDIPLAFRRILDDFFPRYLNILFSPRFKESIKEIRIEGHTSSGWDNGRASEDIAYFENMGLSQSRTRAVLQYCYGLTSTAQQKTLMRKNVTANGLSSSHTISDEKTGLEDPIKSRRVEFRTITDAEQKIVEILRELGK